MNSNFLDKNGRKAPDKFVLSKTGETKREWKRRKRKEFDCLMKAYQKFLLGSAFTAVDLDTLLEFGTELYVMKESLSKKHWGD